MYKGLQDPWPPSDHPCARYTIGGVVDRDLKPLGIAAQILPYEHPGGNPRNDLRYAVEENDFLPFCQRISQAEVKYPHILLLTCAVSQYFFQGCCHFNGNWLNKAIFDVSASFNHL